MGLDMFLNAKITIFNIAINKIQKCQNETFSSFEKIEKLEDEIKNITGIKYSPQDIEFEIIYWRKANHIHNWFMKNVGNDENGPIKVSEDDLKKLLTACEEVMKNKSRAAEILPTVSGFFFGSTEYDDYYFEETESTAQNIKEFLESEFPKDNISYKSSW